MIVFFWWEFHINICIFKNIPKRTDNRWRSFEKTEFKKHKKRERKEEKEKEKKSKNWKARDMTKNKMGNNQNVEKRRWDEEVSIKGSC